MIEVVGALVAYREREIGGAVRTLSAWCDRIVGVSAPFVGSHLLERDDTIERAIYSTSLPTAWKSFKLMSEVAARNAVIALVKQEAGLDAWALVLDGDEMLLAESVFVEKTELGQMLAKIRAGKRKKAVGLTVYSTQMVGVAKTPEDWQRMPIVSAAGTQPRLFPVKDAKYQASVRGAPGLFINDVGPYKPFAVDKAVVINARHRQLWQDYQSDHQWESSLDTTRPAP